jgi:hypothetical protein
MNEETVKQFLIKAKKSGYAAGGEATSTRTEEEDGSKSTRFEEGDLKFHDNWFGGEPYGGREVVHYLGKPYWLMVYYGKDDQTAEGAIPLLLKALTNLPEELPVRGPKLLEDGEYRYENNWSGDLFEFFGEEKIYFQNKEVYYAKYQGGLVDQKEG